VFFKLYGYGNVGEIIMNVETVKP